MGSRLATSSQAELLVLLYRGAVRFAAKARLHLQSREIEAAHNNLMRAQQIVLELTLGLKPSADPSVQDLCGLHNYIYRLLYDANLRKSTALVDEALGHLRDLLATWEQIAIPATRPPAKADRVVSIDRHC
jgi:flagellar protein FliS